MQTAPFNLFDMDRKDGQYLLSSYGSVFAFGWFGTPEFCQLTENLVENYSFTNGSVHKGNHYIYYILTSKEKLERNLTRFFAAAIAAKEAKVEKTDNEESGADVTWDERLVEAEASRRAAYFMEHVLRKDNFILDLSKDAA